MMIKILLALAAIFGIFWTIKERKIIPGIITLGMITGTALVLIPLPALRLPGFYSYMGFVGVAFIYGLIVPGKNTWERVIICLMSASLFTYWLWVLNHWHGNTLLLPIFTLLVLTAGVIRKVKLKDELGFIVLLAADAVAILIEQAEKGF